MKMIAIGTVKLKGAYVALGAEFDVEKDEAGRLVELGIARLKTREIPDDGKGGAGA